MDKSIPKMLILWVDISTHWGQVTHKCVVNLTLIGSDNGQRQAITWTNVGILLIEPQGTNFSEMIIEIHILSFKKIHLKMSSGKWRPFCLGFNVLRIGVAYKHQLTNSLLVNVIACCCLFSATLLP